MNLTLSKLILKVASPLKTKADLYFMDIEKGAYVRNQDWLTNLLGNSNELGETAVSYK